MQANFYVYIHRRKTDGSIFYVGKGSGKRLYDQYGRNTHWKRVAEKHGFDAAVVRRFKREECALTFEKIMIYLIGRNELTNQPDGGEGVVKPSADVRLKMSLAKKGWKPPEKSEETRQKLSIVNSKQVVTNFGEVFDSGKKAAQWLRENGYPAASRGNISACLNGKMRSCYDRTWSFGSDAPEAFDRATSYASARGRKTVRSDGKVFISASDACSYMRSNGHPKATQGNISSVCRGERGDAYGYGWSYVDA